MKYLLVFILVCTYFNFNPVKEKEKVVIKFKIQDYRTTCKITGYNATVNQCDSTPLITASNKKVRLGMVAVSRDLEKKYNLHFGDYVFINGLGLFEFQDRMNKRIKNTIDIFCWNRKTAFKLTRKSEKVTFIKVTNR